MNNSITELISYLTFSNPDIINIYIYTPLINKPSDFLNKLDIKKYKKCTIDNFECCICCLNIKKSEYIRELNCNHIFHKKCIDHWLLISIKEKKTINCPVCRTNVNIIS